MTHLNTNITLTNIIREWIKDVKFRDRLWVWSDINRDYLLIYVPNATDGVTNHWAADIFEDRIICRDTKWQMFELSVFDKQFFDKLEKILLNRLDWYGPIKYNI